VKSERDEIFILLSKDYSYREISRSLGRSVSTISNEINLNSVNGKYYPDKAQHKAYVRRKYSKFQGKKIVDNPKLQGFIEENLYDDQSPTNISGRIKKHEKHLPFVSKESIYRYIKSVYGRRIEYHRSKRKRHRWSRRRRSKEKLMDRKFIEQRPKIVGKRGRIGDVEADFIVSGKSGKGIVLVVVDRKSRCPFLEQILKVTIENVHLAFLEITRRFPEIKTITTDNDLLMARHKELEKLLNTSIYFCHTYSSWEKGTVENRNKAIRRYAKKGSDLSKYSISHFAMIEDKLRTRYMKCLNFKTPKEMFEKEMIKYEKQQQKNRLKAVDYGQKNQEILI